jgi:putative intracellular protease/amidase
MWPLTTFMKDKAYLLVFDGLADWEPAYAMCEINKSEKFEVLTVGFESRSIKTMGGLKIIPDVSLNDVDPSSAAIFIMPGGDMWEQRSFEDLKELLHRLDSARVPIAAICGATLEIARAGLTHNRRHTSNFLGYLKGISSYDNEAFYVDELAVTDQNLITASGLGSLEFAREVIKKLAIYDDSETAEWYEMFKNGVIPARYDTA